MKEKKTEFKCQSSQKKILVYNSIWFADKYMAYGLLLNNIFNIAYIWSNIQQFNTCASGYFE